MNNLKISYLVTCYNETQTLIGLLNRIDNYKLDGDEIVIMYDVGNGTKETKQILIDFCNGVKRCDVLYVDQYKLNNDYGAHKNQAIQLCSKDFIFAIDGDELPPEALLGENLHALLENNPTIEAFAVPRINDFRGVTPNHAAQWGWRLTESPTYKRPIVNWPDYQFRIFKKDFPRISFLRRLHEKIEGYSSYVCLPPEEEYALYHDKTIETQLKTNARYNQVFSQDENRGHNVFSNK